MQKRHILFIVGFLGVMVFFSPFKVIAATIYANSLIGNDTSGSGASSSPYLTFTKAYTSANSGDTINLTGTFTWTDAGETGDVVTSGYTVNKNITIQGQGADQTIVQAATASTTADRRVFTISSGVTATIQNLEIRNGRVTSAYGGGIQNNGTLSVIASRIDNNISGDGGSGIDNLNLLTVASSTIDHNLSNGSTGMGAGLLNDYYIVPGGYMTVTDSTIAWNTITATTGYYSGAGIHFRKGSGTITNSAITKNESCESAVGMDDTGSILTIKNTIIANNLYHYGSYCTNTGAYVDFAYRQSGYGNVVDNGNNIVGYSNYYTWTGAGDWTDTNRDGTFVLQTVGTTGSLNLSSTLATNSATNGVQTLALSSGSIAIDNGGTGTNGATSTVPTLDQRNASRSGATDIGAYEYNGTIQGADITAPTVSILLPTANEATSSSVTLMASSSDNVAVAGVTFYINGTKIGSEVTSAPYSLGWDSTATSSGTYSIVAVARDSSNNYATSTPISFTVSNSGPIPASISSSGTTNGAIITWNTNMVASSIVNFGLTNAYGSSTSEIDISPRVTTHSVSISGLPSCAVYHFEVESKDSVLDIATSSDSTFETTGCTGSSSISTTTQNNILSGSGGSVSESAVTLTVPASFTSTSTSAIFQINELDASLFFATAGTPLGVSKATTPVFNMKAFVDATTTLSTFTSPLTITLTYSPSDITGLDPTTLKIYRYDDSLWTPLSSCVTNTSLNTVTCATSNFSDFAIFGYVLSTPNVASSSGIAPMAGGGGYYVSTPNISITTCINGALYNVVTGSLCSNAPHTSPVSNSFSVLSPSLGLFILNLQTGTKNTEVKLLQEYLNSHDFIVAKVGAGSVGNETTTFGPATKAALIKFQKAYGITPAKGYFGPITRAYIASHQ